MPRLTIPLLGCLMMPLLSSCATNGASPNSCVGWSPILVGRNDVIPPGVARQILAHDIHGQQECGWR